MCQSKNLDSGNTSSDSTLQGFEERLRRLLKNEGQSADPGPEDELPQVGKFQVVDVLPPGGQAFVFLAFDTQLQRRVVLKFYKQKLSKDQKKRLFEEGRALARVNDSQVVTCYEIGEFEGQMFLALEYVSGTPLNELIRNCPPSEVECLRITRQIAKALSHVHAMGMLHRDLKPGNVIIQSRRRIKLIDFGLVQSIGVVDHETLSGTPSYMAPEQATGSWEEVDFRTDIFGVGAILYQLLTQTPPYIGNDKSEVIRLACEGRVRPAIEINPGLSRTANDICMRCLAREPADRFDSATELATTITCYLNSQKTRLSKRTLVLGASALAILLIAIAAWTNGRESAMMSQTAGPEMSQIPRQTMESIEEIISSGRLNEKSHQTLPMKIGLRNQTRQLDAASNRVCELVVGEKFIVDVHPAVDCYVGVFSLECATGSLVVNHLKPIYPSSDKIAIFVGGNHRESFVINPSSISPTTEFLFVLASCEPWSTSQLVSWFNASVSKGVQKPVHRARLWRGLEAAGMENPIAFEAIIPYLVVAPDKD